MRRLVKFVAILLTGLVGLVIVAIVALALIPDGTYRKWISAGVQSATGRKLTIGGAFHVGIFPTLAITAEDIHFANVDEGSRPDMFTAERLEARLALIPLITGIAEIHLEADRPDLLLETDASGRGNWHMRAPAGPAGQERVTSESSAARGLPVRIVPDIRIHAMRLAYLDHRFGRRAEAEIDSLALNGTGEETTAELTGRIDGTPLALAGSLGRIGEVLGTGSTTVRFDGRLGETTLTIEGSAGPFVPSATADLSVEVHADSLAAIATLAGTELPELGALDVAARLVVADGSYSLRELEISLAGETTTATVTGELADLMNVEGLALKAEMRTDAPAELIEAVGAALPVAVPSTVTMTGTLTGGVERLALANLEVTLRDAGLEATLTGKADDMLSPAGVAVHVALEADSTAALSKFAGRDLPALGAVSVSASIASAAERLTLRDVQADLVGEHVAARVTGSVHDLLEVQGLALDVQASTAALPELLETLGVEAPVRMPSGLDVSATLTGGLDTLRVHDLDARVRDDAWELALVGTVGMGTPIALTVEGHVREQPYALALDAGPLDLIADLSGPWPLKISGHVAGTPVDVEGEIGGTGAERAGRFELAFGQVDGGAILAWLGVAEGIDASTDKLELKIALRGDDVRELARHAVLSASLEGGRWTLRDPNTGATLAIHLLEGAIRAEPDRPVTLTLTGQIDQTPVSLTIQGAPLVDYVSEPKGLPLEITAQAAGAELRLAGGLDLPITRRALRLTLDLRGERLDTLDQLFNVDLPPLGPYRLGAQFAVLESGYDLSDLIVKVGESDLGGRMSLDTTGTRPRLDIALATSRLQIDDFDVEGWSPTKGRSADAGDTPADAPISAEQVAEAPVRQDPAPLLSPEALRRLDAALSVNVDQVLSGRDVLGGGRLEVRLQEGRFAIDPLAVEVPGGSVGMAFAFHPTETQANIRLEASVDKLDYGILARRVNPETKMGGLLSLDLLLHATAPDLAELMANASGYLDFGLWPKAFDAKIIDLWAVNLLSALSKQVDAEPQSVVNCVVARFTMERGLMKEQVIFMDTTRMSVEGTAEVDFKRRHVDLRVRPRAKRPEFFSAATPVTVKGQFEDFGLDVSLASVAGSVVSMVTSPVHVPIRRLFGTRRPADGEVACREAWEETEID